MIIDDRIAPAPAGSGGGSAPAVGSIDDVPGLRADLTELQNLAATRNAKPRKARVQTDTQRREFRTTSATPLVGKVWGTHTYAAGAKLRLTVQIPWTSLGGLSGWYWHVFGVVVEYSSDGGTSWTRIGHSGECWHAGNSPWNSRAFLQYANSFLWTAPAPAGEDTVSLTFRFLHWAYKYGNTWFPLVVNVPAGNGGGTQFIVEEL